MYKPLQIQATQTRNAKNLSLNHPSKYKPPWGHVLGNCPVVQSKTEKNSKFLSKNKAGPIANFPPHISPSKRAFEKYKPRGLFSEFYGTHLTVGIVMKLLVLAHLLTVFMCRSVVLYINYTHLICLYRLRQRFNPCDLRRDGKKEPHKRTCKGSAYHMLHVRLWWKYTPYSSS